MDSNSAAGVHITLSLTGTYSLDSTNAGPMTLTNPWPSARLPTKWPRRRVKRADSGSADGSGNLSLFFDTSGPGGRSRASLPQSPTTSTAKSGFYSLQQQ